MSLELVGPLYDLVVKGMLNMILDGNNNGFIHFITGNLAGTGLS
jgi:hypothetical protein